MQRAALVLLLLAAIAPLRVASGQGEPPPAGQGTAMDAPERKLLTVWNGIPISDPGFPTTRELPKTRGRITNQQGDLDPSALGVAKRVELERLEGAVHATLARGQKQRPRVKLRVSVRSGRVRAFLEYIAGYHVLCEAAPGRACEIEGLLYEARQSRVSIFSGHDGAVLVEALDGSAEGLLLEVGAP